MLYHSFTCIKRRRLQPKVKRGLKRIESPLLLPVKGGCTQPENEVREMETWSCSAITLPVWESKLKSKCLLASLSKASWLILYELKLKHCFPQFKKSADTHGRLISIHTEQRQGFVAENWKIINYISVVTYDEGSEAETWGRPCSWQMLCISQHLLFYLQTPSIWSLLIWNKRSCQCYLQFTMFPRVIMLLLKIQSKQHNIWFADPIIHLCWNTRSIMAVIVQRKESSNKNQVEEFAIWPFDPSLHS